MSGWGPSGWAVREGSGIRVEQGPHHREVLLRGQDVNGAMGAFVFTHDVIEVNPPHAHTGFMKILYILDGEYDVRVGDATFHGGPGTLVVVPQGSQHAFTTHTGGRILFVCAPSGNEEMFLEMGRLGSDASAAQLEDVKRRFGMLELGGEPWTAE